jgi:endonuclease/exonuclease/phosphatase family metal-dependent hydrolase
LAEFPSWLPRALFLQRGLVALLAVLLLPLAPAAQPQVRIDGSFDDWQQPFAARADGEFLYLRFTLPWKVTLQGARRPIRLLLDADGDPSTGRHLPDTPEGIGPEAIVTFSPTGKAGKRGGGVGVRVVQAGGKQDAPIPAAALDLVLAPTTASRTFEVRLARTIDGQSALSAALDEGRVRMAVVAAGGQGGREWSSGVVSLSLPPRAIVRTLLDALPARDPDGLRVVSWNVFFGRPRSQPEGFARVLRALKPDILLVQEWDQVDGAALAGWFDKHVPAAAPWHAMTASGWGVGIVSRTPLSRLSPERIERPEGAPADDFRPDEALRLVSAQTSTRIGPVALASVHLRCCGHDGSWQDEARVAEAAAVARQLQAVISPDDALRVVGGDLNLVGSRRPLEALGRGLGSGGGNLQAVDSPLLGEGADYSWRNPRSPFTPGRLDWVLHGGARGALATAFLFDSQRLSEAGRRRTKIEAGDTDQSDHLPLVVDFRLPGTQP